MIIMPQSSALEKLDDDELEHLYLLAQDLKLDHDFIDLVKMILNKRKYD